MARSTSPRETAGGKPGGIWSGILIGLFAGLGAAVLIAVWLGHNNPFTARGNTGASTPPAPTAAAAPGQNAPIVDPATRAAPVDSHFDFYHMLQNNSPTGGTPGPAATPPAPAPQLWLQVGSFAGAGEADDLKARLALMGYEASIQTVDLPDKGTRHRVRLGPYTAEEAARVTTTLQQNGIAVSRQNGAAKPAGSAPPSH